MKKPESGSDLKKSAPRIKSDNLTELAIKYGTDKYGKHYYTQHYETHFRKLRRRKLSILEIGVGGYKDPHAGGKSLRMWRDYFPHSQIFGIDIYDKSPHDEERIKTFQGSQIDTDFLQRVADEIGSIDIIIDDGSHLNSHVITTFNFLFPLLKDRGIYAVEDTQTSYWKKVAGTEWGGSSDLTSNATTMGYFKSLTDGLNYEEFVPGKKDPTYFDRHIISMHFYHSLIIIHKGTNNEGSPFLERIKRDFKLMKLPLG
jgi:hypothetical protein